MDHGEMGKREITLMQKWFSKVRCELCPDRRRVRYAHCILFQANGSQALTCIKVTRRACENTQGPTPDFLTQETWSGARESAFPK